MDDPCRVPFRLDPDRARNHAPITLAKKADVVDAVQQRDHDGVVHRFAWSERERRLESGCLRCQPEHVDGSVEARGCGRLGVEHAEKAALDANATGIRVDRAGANQKDDGFARARECSAD